MTLSEFLNISQDYLSYIKLGLFALCNYLVLDPHTFEILFLLMCVDTVTGSIKSIVLNRDFSFKALLWGLLTKIGILLIPVTVALMAKGLSFDFRWLVLLVMNILIISEGFSIFTNTLSIKQKKQIENVDFITMLLKAIRNGLKNIVTRLLKHIDSGEPPKNQ